MKRLVCELAAVAVLVLGASACSTPLNDITSTVSGDVGPWDVSDAKVNGDHLSANVCMSDMDSSEAISDRLLLQLRNKGYQQIELAMYATERNGSVQQRQVSWTPHQGKQMQTVSQAGQNPCAARNEASDPAAEQKYKSNSSIENRGTSKESR